MSLLLSLKGVLAVVSLLMVFAYSIYMFIISNAIAVVTFLQIDRSKIVEVETSIQHTHQHCRNLYF